MFGMGTFSGVFGLLIITFMLFFIVISLAVPFFIWDIKHESRMANWRLGQILKIMEEERNTRVEGKQNGYNNLEDGNGNDTKAG